MTDNNGTTFEEVFQDHGAGCGCCPPKAEPFQRQLEKIGRNDPCPCDSGKKYKKCCG